MQNTKKAIILLSGGQDSTTCLYWAAKRFDELHAIGFDYGQMHARELEFAQRNAAKVGAMFEIINVQKLLAPSSLTEHSNHNQKSYLNKDLPASFTAGRNLLFLTIAASRAAAQGINDIVTGVCQTDYSGYPDCRRNTIDAQQLTLSLGIGAGDFRIHTPLMYLDKAQTWKLAAELDCVEDIQNYTLTDYNGDMTPNPWGYGKTDNPASKLRAEGYFNAKKLGWI